MAKRVSKGKAKKLDEDLREEWEVTEAPKEKKRGFKLSNNVLWLVFILVVLAFIALPFLGRSSGSGKMQTEFVNGIEITAPGDPVAAVKGIQDLHVTGKTINNLTDENNALQEIGAVVGTSKIKTYGGSYALLTGITDRTGIFIDKDSFRVEGKTPTELWKAVWTFTSIVSDTTIDSSVDWYGVQDMLTGFADVSLVDNSGDSCRNQYGKIVIAEGDILSSLGFKQAQLRFNLSQYQKNGDKCQTLVNDTLTEATCPSPGLWSFVVTIQKGDTNLISIRQNEITLQYASCDSASKVSTILRDLLHPSIVSDLANIRMPITL